MELSGDQCEPDTQKIRSMVMIMRHIAICTCALLGAIALQGTSAHALSMHECSAKYEAAKEAGTLNGTKWNDFRKTQCGVSASPAPATAVKTPTTTGTSRAAEPSHAPATSGNAVFPSAISPKHSSESPGKARMETCLDQYKANKANNANGGLRWVQKGGGYYSECNRHLKGPA